MAWIRTWIVFGLSLSLLADCSPLVAQEPCTITVQPGESIQAAIDVAPEGAVICLAEGEWEENLVIEKSLTLRGQGAEQTVIWSGGFGSSSLRIFGDSTLHVVIEDLGVVGGPGLAAIHVSRQARLTLMRARVSGANAAVWADDSAQVKVVESTISESAIGVVLRGSPEAIGIACTVTRNVVGVLLGDSARLEVTNCQFTHSDFAPVWAGGNAQVSVMDSSLVDNGGGILLDGSAQARVTGSTVSGNGQHGITVTGAARAEIARCTVSRHSEAGIAAFDSARVAVLDSTVAENWHGVLIRNLAEVVLERNAIVGNDRYGVVLADEGCLPAIPGVPGHVGGPFQGYVEGKENRIADPSRRTADVAALVCPASLAFLATAQGGSLGEPREEAVPEKPDRAEITVQPGESIQAAIDAAPPGAVITLAEGEWEETLWIDKSLTLQGQGPDKTVLRGPAEEQIMVWISPTDPDREVVLENLGVSGGEIGVLAAGASRVILRNCRFTDSLWDGVWVLSEAIVEGCEFVGNGVGLSVAGPAQATVSQSRLVGNRLAGVEAQGDARVAIENTVFAKAGWAGVSVRGNAKAVVQNCRFEEGIGVHVDHSARATIAQTVFSRNTYGIVAADTAQVDVVGCTIADGTAWGIRADNSSQVTVTDSTISGNQVGIGVRVRARVTVTGCVLEGNEWGVGLAHYARATIVETAIRESARSGVSATGSSQVTIRASAILDSGGHGIVAADKVQVTIEASSILRSGGYGVALQEGPCLDTDAVFSGVIRVGPGVVAPGPDEPDGNRAGAACPPELVSLFAEEGGELDRRE